MRTIKTYSKGAPFIRRRGLSIDWRYPQTNLSRCGAMMRHWPKSGLSDAGVPGVAGFWLHGTQTFAEALQTVRDG